MMYADEWIEDDDPYGFDYIEYDDEGDEVEEVYTSGVPPTEPPLRKFRVGIIHEIDATDIIEAEKLFAIRIGAHHREINYMEEIR